MSKEDDKLVLESIKKEKLHYANFVPEELKMLKTHYEAKEEDNKQIAFVLSLVSIALALQNVVLNSLSKDTKSTTAMFAFGFVALVIVVVAYIGIRTSIRNIETTRKRKIIDLVLAEKAAKQNPPTPTP